MYISPKIELITKDKEKESFFCDVCSFCLLSKEDFDYHEKYGTCEECYQTFVEAVNTTWQKGKTLINKKKLREYIYLRKKISSKKINLKEEV